MENFSDTALQWKEGLQMGKGTLEKTKKETDPDKICRLPVSEVYEWLRLSEDGLSEALQGLK